jgi:hypothetical protein
MNRRKLFKCLLMATFVVPTIAKAVNRRNKQRALYAEQEELYRRLRPAWWINRGELQNLGRTVYYAHLDEANYFRRTHELSD